MAGHSLNEAVWCYPEDYQYDSNDGSSLSGAPFDALSQLSSRPSVPNIPSRLCVSNKNRLSANNMGIIVLGPAVLATTTMVMGGRHEWKKRKEYIRKIVAEQKPTLPAHRTELV